MTNAFDRSLQAKLSELVLRRGEHLSQRWFSFRKLKREVWESMFPPNHETLRAIREFLETHGHAVVVTPHELIVFVVILGDIELLRVYVEQGADPSYFDQRFFWPWQRIRSFPNPPTCRQFFYFARVLRARFVQCTLQGITLAVDENVLRQVLEYFGEISPDLVFSKHSLLLTSVNKGMFDILAALAKLDLAKASFLEGFEKQLLPLRGAENYFISLLRCGKWHRTKREIVILAARYGHLRLLRELLNDRGDDEEDYVRLALFNSDRLDVLQMLVSEYNADVNTFDDEGNTVLHSLCRSVAAHAEDSLRWLFTSTDFVLVDLEHNEGGTALDVVCAHLNFSLMGQLLHYGYGYSLPLTKREIEKCALFGMPLIGYVCARTQIPVSAALLCVKEFIRRDASLNTRDMRGDSPVILSSRYNNLELMSLLLRNYPDPGRKETLFATINS